jgi:hypothetical protein
MFPLTTVRFYGKCCLIKAACQARVLSKRRRPEIVIVKCLQNRLIDKNSRSYNEYFLYRSHFKTPLLRLLGLLESAKFAALNFENSSASRNQTVQDFTLRFTKRFWSKAPNNGSSGDFEMTSNKINSLQQAALSGTK